MSRISKMTRAAVSCMAVALVSGVWAETWTDSAGYTWTYRISGNSAEINNGYSTAISPPPYDTVTIPSALGGKPVTSIGDYAFAYCSGLTSVTIPDSVTSIGRNAFGDCSELANVVIGSGVTSIGDSAFKGCSGLISITVDCGNANYKSVNGLLLSKDGKTLIQGVNGDVTIPDSVTSIGAYAFYNCSGLKSVTIPDSVMSIGDWAFRSCGGLKSVTIPDSVTSIGAYAFSGCRGLASVVIGSGVTSIGNYAFYDCSGLKSVTFLGDAPRVDSYAFRNVNSSCVASVSPKSMGWGVGVGEKWNGLMLQYWPEILTDISSDAAVGDVMDKFADRRLVAQVMNKVEYDAFRAWVNGNNLYQPNVVESTRTWLSYALGADALINKEITSNDVRIVAFETANADNGAMGSPRPTFAFEVAIDNVNIGGGMVAVETLKENLKKVLDVEGATTLSPDAFASDNIEITFDTPVDGKARFIATPPANAGNTFFMRVKVK